MLHRTRLMTVAIAMTALAACGAHGSSNGSGGKSPDQAVRDAVTRAQQGAVHATFTSSDVVDRASLKNLPAQVSKALAELGSSGGAKGTVDQESGSRRSATVQVNNRAAEKLVQYDNRLFASGGGGFREIPTNKVPANLQLTRIDLTSFTGAFSFHDVGAETQDGTATEHYSGPVDAAALHKLAQALSSASNQLSQFIQLAIPFTTIDRGSLDVWVNSKDGSLVRASLSSGFHVDVGAIATALSQAGSTTPTPGVAQPSGRLGLIEEFDIHVRSAPGITVTLPPATVSPGGGGGSPSPTP